MPYHLDFSALDLGYIERRLANEDLIPSLEPLREGLPDKLRKLEKAGMGSIEALEAALAKAKGLAALAEASGIDAEWLKRMGRMLRGWRTEPCKLKEYPFVSKAAVGGTAEIMGALAGRGIADSKALWEAARAKNARAALAREAGIDPGFLLELCRLSDLSRVQWVSPLFARLLLDAGYGSVARVAAARPEELYAGVDAANAARGRLYKGRVGLRDMGRLVYLAGLLPFEL
jgi:hypothetical protein